MVRALGDGAGWGGVVEVNHCYSRVPGDARVLAGLVLGGALGDFHEGVVVEAEEGAEGCG